jgi:putative Holliday junction resolvase
VRILGVDYGRRRLGLALSDEDGLLASPLPTHLRRRRPRADFRYLARLIEREHVGRAVVGLPLHMNGSAGEMAIEASAFAERLSNAAQIPVDVLDERLTTAEADRILREASVPRAKRRGLRDGLAATQILQCYLDRRRSSA